MSAGINGLGKTPATTIAENQRNHSAKSANGESRSTQSLKQDSVALTDTLTNLQRLSNIMANEAPVNHEKVAALRESISEGTYVVDAEATARNFARLERELGGL